MNIFVLDERQSVAVDGLCDKHLTKMPLETVQILNTALHINGSENLTFYGRGYVNHPCCTWAAESFKNWKWLYDYGVAIGERFEAERGKPHTSIEKMDSFDVAAVSEALPNGDYTTLPQCMPDDCKRENVVDGYRTYYNDVKSKEDWFDESTCKKTYWKK